jgi:hypothetical protein
MPKTKRRTDMPHRIDSDDAKKIIANTDQATVMGLLATAFPLPPGVTATAKSDGSGSVWYHKGTEPGRHLNQAEMVHLAKVLLARPWSPPTPPTPPI